MEGVYAVAAVVARHSPGRRPLSRRDAPNYGRAIHPRAVSRPTVARTDARRGSIGLIPVLGAVGLLVTFLAAIWPAYASAQAPVVDDGSTLDVRATADDGEIDGVAVPPLVSATWQDGQHLAPMSWRDGIERPRSAPGAPAAVGWYRLAAAEQGVSADLLRALHEVESGAAPDGCLANAQGSGAIGPFQFKRATFRQYGVDANHDGYRDICSFADALFSAARYLRALGVGGLDDPGTRYALARYGTDPDLVLVLARGYRERAVFAH